MAGEPGSHAVIGQTVNGKKPLDPEESSLLKTYIFILIKLVGEEGVEPSELKSTRFTVRPATTYGIFARFPNRR
jgi:hypothetical protein